MDIKTQLILEIRKTFKSRLETKQIFIKTAGQYFDVDEVVEELFYEIWYKVPLAILIKHRIHLASFNAVGFHFYLPAMLTAIIKYPHDVDTLTGSILFYLCPPPQNTPERIRFDERVSLFTIDESQIISKLLESYFDLFPPDEWSFNAKLVNDLNTSIHYWKTRHNEV